MQRRIQKLLTGGSRISVTCIAANPHPQSIIQSRFLLHAFFFNVFIIVSVLQRVMKQTHCWKDCTCHNTKTVFCLSNLYKVFNL